MRTLVLLLVFLTAVPAAIADSTPHWIHLRSEHFVILTDSSEKQARHLANQFERMRIVFQKLIPNSTADSGTGPIIVLALKDKKSFQSVEPSAYLAKGQINLAGLFLSGPDKNYIVLRLDAEGEHPFATVYHEYTHFVVRKVTWLPLWMNEGMAEFYQNTDIQDDDVLLGKPSFEDILFLRQSALLPLPTLLAVDHDSPYYHDEQKGSVFYAESWALIHFIIVSDRKNHTDRFEDYAKALASGQDSLTAAQQTFGDLKQLQSSLQAYVQQGDFSMFKMPLTITVDPSTFQVLPISTTEADAIRADVLVDDGRSKDAQALLEAVLREDLKNAQAHETMGSLKFREGDHEAAKKWYTEAVQMDSHSYLAHYYFAVLSMPSSNAANHDVIEASFKEAIKLNPTFAPAYDAFAEFYSMHREKLSEAHMLTAQAVHSSPKTSTIASMQPRSLHSSRTSLRHSLCFVPRRKSRRRSATHLRFTVGSSSSRTCRPRCSLRMTKKQ